MAGAKGGEPVPQSVRPSDRIALGNVRCTRLGTVLSPDGSEMQAGGVLNPAATRDRRGNLLLYPRLVTAQNVSRIGLARCQTSGHDFRCQMLGVAIEPEMDYETSDRPDSYGCEDARVTFVSHLDSYVMTYTAYDSRNARIALAVSTDAYSWTKLGVVRFNDAAIDAVDNKNAAFFPQPVFSPTDVLSFAFYHRPMAFSAAEPVSVTMIRELDPNERDAACLAYVAMGDAMRDIRNLRFPKESVKVLPVGEHWGRLRNGAGTPPVRVAPGWLSLFHGVDAADTDDEARIYQAGIVIHDPTHPHRVLYRSPEPILSPTTKEETRGVVDNVVFPTGIDPITDGTFDIYYGTADYQVARARLVVVI